MSNLAASQSDNAIDPLGKLLTNSDEVAGKNLDLKVIRRNKAYLNLLIKLGNEPNAIFDVKPDQLKGALALKFLRADELMKNEIHLELQRWALYFSDSLDETNDFISSIESKDLSDTASIAEIASMTQQLVDVADSMFED